MNSLDHQKAGEIFNEALDLPVDQRPDFLTGECGSDAELRAEVESLLASHNEKFLEENVRERVLELVCGGLLPGDVISDRYTIVEMIGSGGMGEVYLAEDTKIPGGRKVALKVLAEKFSQDQKQVRNFENEARTISRLNNPNILTVHDFVYVDNTSFIITEFIEGETLRTKLQSGPLELSSALKIARQIASALAAVHERGIIHRDVKPENIIVKDDGHVKVVDFGIAKLAERRTPEDDLDPTWISHEEAASGFGTANYMSWEQVRGQDVDARTDIWSLGVCLYEMLTGTPPFKGEKWVDTFSNILKDDPAPLGQQVPESLNAIIKKALKRNREKRYQTMREFAAELERTPDTANTVVDPFREWRKTSGARIWATLLGVAGLSCVLAALALAVYFFQSWTAESAARSAQAVASGFHLIVIGIAYWYFHKHPGPQDFRRLKHDKAEGRLRPHITYSTGYEKVSDWKRAREIAKEALKHYRAAFVWLLFAWLFLYTVTLISLVEESFIVASVLTLANNFNTLCIGLCFAILNEPITTEDKTQNKKAIRVKEGRKWPASLIPAAIVMIFLLILELWLASKLTLKQETVHYVFRVISGLAGGVAMALFVGRFQSKFLKSPPWLVYLLFLYTVIQALFIFYGGESPGELAWAAVVMNAALVLKCLLIVYMFWLFQSGRLLFYLVRVRRAATQVDSEWQNFREVLQPES